ncbi:hypothetical protein [Candidatus Amarolinea aalborgensis]|jgi:hypothetical protein|uniref:hypothetical protein n=1 Tax=Candidatus Amarolinea aalborgensis TaxID=2249329 RepID=UPI003BF9910B
MSTLAVGSASSIAAPLVAAAVAIAGAGVLVARESAKAILACGSELKAMADENLALQRQLRAAAANYEREQLQAAHAQRQRNAAKLQQQVERQQELQLERSRRLKSSKELVTAGADSQSDWAAVDRMRSQVIPDSRPQNITFEMASGWPQKVRHLRAWTDRLRQCTDRFADGANAHLFDVSGLIEMNRKLDSRIAGMEVQAIDTALGKTLPSVAIFEETVAVASYLERRLKEMEALAPERQKLRQRAIKTLWQAQEALHTVLNAPDADTYLGSVEHISRILDDAERALSKAEFTSAISGAEAVLRHLQSVRETGQRLRQRNLMLLLNDWQKRMEPLAQFSELKPKVEEWLRKNTDVRALLERDIASAWLQADQAGGLLDTAESLFQQATDLLLRATAELLAKNAGECLSEMGYRIDTRSGDGVRTLIGRKPDGKEFYLTIDDLDEMAFKVEGHGNESCKTALREFMDRLRSKGVGASYQSEFSLGLATQQLVHLLQSKGFDVRIEPAEDGVTILAEGQPALTGKINFDGVVPSSLTPQMLDLWRRQVEETHEPEPANSTSEDEWSKAQKAWADMQPYRLKEAA